MGLFRKTFSVVFRGVLSAPCDGTDREREIVGLTVQSLNGTSGNVMPAQSIEAHQLKSSKASEMSVVSRASCPFLGFLPSGYHASAQDRNMNSMKEVLFIFCPSGRIAIL
jgi:hypothetical protein